MRNCLWTLWKVEHLPPPPQKPRLIGELASKGLYKARQDITLSTCEKMFDDKNMLLFLQEMESPTTSPSVDWQAKYLEAWQSYRDARKKNREQSRRARQLMAAVAAKLQQKEEEMAEVKNGDKETVFTAAPFFCLHLSPTNSTAVRPFASDEKDMKFEVYARIASLRAMWQP